MYDTRTGKHTNLTNRPGEDRNPVFAPDGKQVYFLSEREKGSFNVYRFPLDNPKQVQPLTSFTTHPVRFLSVAGNGTLCYTYIYTQAPQGQPQKVAVSLITDAAELPETLTFTKGASEAVVSPDGKQVAFIVRGEVFVTSVEYGTTKQIRLLIRRPPRRDFRLLPITVPWCMPANGPETGSSIRHGLPGRKTRISRTLP